MSTFDPRNAATWDEQQLAVYETGHREGESCRQADWHSALSDYCELPDGVDSGEPTQVAEFIALLQEEVEAHRATIAGRIFPGTFQSRITIKETRAP